VFSDTDGGAVDLSSAHRGAVDLTSGYRTSGRPRVSGPSIPARKGPSGAERCDVPGISLTDPAGVWKLPDPIVT